MHNGASPLSISDQVLAFIEYTNQHIFLTGKAGTGKTTLLKRIKAESTKKMVVVAPTGVAAMNAKGTTINSFFQLPTGSFFPGDISIENLQSGIMSIQSLVSDQSYSREKLNLLQELELLVIDEASMVRCDLVDLMDAILRSVRKNNAPFGGVQLLLIGDLYQLPPVTKREEWAFLNQVYASPYFFDSHVIRQHPVLQIELTEVFRQTEPEFIEILNSIRNNQIGEHALALLNQRYDPSYQDQAGTHPIVITSHNMEANAINKQKLDELPREEFTFNGETNGEFREAGIQAEQVLKLKAGAQVMFIRNDSGDNRKYYNGKIGTVKSVQTDEIYVSFPDEDDLLLEKTSWQSFEYKTDPEEAIVQQQVGEFSQYPIKLAWAVTIHKSQGLTFDTAVIDAGKSFISGQVYVALSRVRTLNGLILKSKIGTDSLRSNPEVLHFMRPVNYEELDVLLLKGKEQFILQLVLNHFAMHRLLTGLSALSSHPEVVKANLPEFRTLFMQMKKTILELIAVADRFRLQVLKLHQQNGFAELSTIQARIESADAYFRKEINLQLLNPLLKNIRIKPKNKVQQQIQSLMQTYRQMIEIKLSQLQIGTTMLSGPVSSAEYTQWIEKNRSQQKLKGSSASAGQASVALQLF